MKKTAPSAPSISRRRLFGASVGLAALASLPARGAPLDAEALGVVPDLESDQTPALQSAIVKATQFGQRLTLAGGTYRVGTLTLPPGAQIDGLAGATHLVALGDHPIMAAQNADGIRLSGLTFDGGGSGGTDNHSGLIAVQSCSDLAVSDCQLVNTMGNGLFAYQSSGRIANCRVSGIALTGLFVVDSTGFLITGNTVDNCDNGGIRVFRNAAGDDGTIVTSNRISAVRSGSGNGQNGNGINAYLANNVVIADNVISDCDFSAIRVNSTRNAIISDNNCSNCREVAIFSEFGFSGSVIANNVIDTAAQGISIANLDQGGHLAVCSGNVVRSILPASPTNPDTVPVGIFAEADTAITGNVVESVPGIGIGAGWGPYLRNVVIADNVIRDIDFGVVVSVAPEAGKARIANNIIDGARRRAIAAYQWTDAMGEDLAANPDQFETVSVAGNVIVK